MSFEHEVKSLAESYVERYNRRDLVGLAEMYTRDASLFSPYGPEAIGRAEIVAVHAAWFEEDERNKRMSVDQAHAIADLGFCVIRYAGDYPAENGSLTTESGVSVNILKRSAQAGWRFHVTSLNSDTSSHN